MYVGGELVSVLDYRVNDDAVAFPHTYTVPKHRGRGYAGAARRVRGRRRRVDDREAHCPDVLVRRQVVRRPP
ncbi:hypothetical protein Q9Q99_00620 [Curtobacterium flaccumfaciens]|nr:hypothetical protein Q9Q99_00620 [Curtobacterium flaccumfaciens]